MIAAMSGVGFEGIEETVAAPSAPATGPGIPLYGWILAGIAVLAFIVGPIVWEAISPASYEEACQTIIAARSCTP